MAEGDGQTDDNISSAAFTANGRKYNKNKKRRGHDITNSFTLIESLIIKENKCNLVNLTFVGPRIVKYFYSKTNQMHNISNLFYFDNNNLHVSDGLSVHHQESKIVHTTSDICVCHSGSVTAC